MEKQLTAEQILKVIKHDLFYQKRLTEPCLKMINDYSTSSQEVKQENKEVWTLNDSDIIDKIETIIYDNVGFNATFGNMTGIDNAVSEIMHLFRFYQKYSVSSLPKQVLNVTDEQIKKMGLKYQMNLKVGREHLLRDSYIHGLKDMRSLLSPTAEPNKRKED